MTLQVSNDTTPHDRRYDRLVEYTTIIRRLWQRGEAAVTLKESSIASAILKLTPPVPPELMPGFLRLQDRPRQD